MRNQMRNRLMEDVQRKQNFDPPTRLDSEVCTSMGTSSKHRSELVVKRNPLARSILPVRLGWHGIVLRSKKDVQVLI